MEDLDALLADLQSTTAHISSFQQQVERDQANQRSNTASSQSSPRNSTPSPLPPHPSGEQIAGRPGVKQHIIQENSSHQQQQHSYSSERVSSGSSTATYHQERSSSSSTHSQSSLQGVSPVHYNSKPLSSPSNNTSVGSNTISQMSSTVNSNLSELDQLLQDLNSAQFIDQVNRRNASTNQNQMVNGNSQRVVSAPVPPSPTSTTVPPGQPPVGPKPTRVESSNRCQMNPLLHEMENVVPPPMGPPPPPPSQTITRSLGGSSPPVPPFPVFLNLDDPLLKQGVPSASSDCNYSYQSSEYKTSSSTCSTLDRENTLGRGSGFSVHDGHVSAFTPLQPMSHAVGMPDVAEQQHSTSSHSYSKTESMESKSETFQKNQQTKMEHTEQYAAASSSSFSSSSYSSQQQHQQACSQPPPQLMVMDQNQMTPPAAFPLPPDYELNPSEQSHIYKKIERNEPAKSFDGNLQLSQENRDIVTGQEIPISQQFESSVSEQQSQALSEQQSSVTSEVTERTSTSSNVEMEASSASTTATTATITSTTTTTTCTTTTSSTSLHAPPSPTPPFSKVFLQLRKDSGEYDVLPGNTEVNYSQESEDYDLANSFGFQPIADDKELQNSLEWQSRQMSGTSSAVTSTQLQQQQQQMNSQSYVQNAYPQTQSHYQEIPTHAPQTASTATRELDELMASLSEFRMTNRDTSSTTTQHAGSAGGDPAYARPHKNRSPVGAATPASAVNMGSGGAAAHGDQLDSMLGSLQSDMNRQGVSTKTKGLCAACNKPVVSQMITALGKVWHVEHFTCAHCKMTLGTMSFYEREGKAYCEQDYHNLFAPRCAYCSGPITDKCVTALDKTWHPEHFFCGFCGCNFGDQGFHERDGQAYCREDFLKMFAPKCGGCGQPINDSYISALNRHWHPECFVCWDCQRPFGNMSFFDHDGLPYCEQHYHAKRGSLCADCQQPITGPSIIAMGRKFHPKHFTCAFCLKQLNNVTFKEQNNKPYCHPCFSKLFAGTKMMD